MTFGGGNRRNRTIILIWQPNPFPQDPKPNHFPQGLTSSSLKWVAKSSYNGDETTL